MVSWAVHKQVMGWLQSTGQSAPQPGLQGPPLLLPFLFLPYFKFVLLSFLLASLHLTADSPISSLLPFHPFFKHHSHFLLLVNLYKNFLKHWFNPGENQEKIHGITIIFKTWSAKIIIYGLSLSSSSLCFSINQVTNVKEEKWLTCMYWQKGHY